MWQVQSTRNKRPALVPKRCCGLQATETARQFNASWVSDIQLLRHDCHHHTAELVRVLTGAGQWMCGSSFLSSRLPIWM